MTYGFNDMRQAALGAFVATFFFFVLRSGDPISISPTAGFILGTIWIYLCGAPFLNKGIESKMHFIGNVLVTVVLSTIFAYVFKLVEYNIIYTFDFFGSAAWLGALMGISSAQFFDRNNVNNMYERWYIKKPRKSRRHR